MFQTTTQISSTFFPSITAQTLPELQGGVAATLELLAVALGVLFGDGRHNTEFLVVQW